MWALSDVPRLTENARAAIADPLNDVFVSAIAAWEITVKRAKDHLTAPDNLSSVIEEWGFEHLPLTFFHAEQAGLLPMHPFDRLLIAQVQAEGLILVTRGRHIRRYGIRTLAA